MAATLDLTPDELLTTTRAVRKRLDLSRDVPIEVVRECLEVAVQAPTGSNRQGWHWMVVTDAGKRAALADLYKQGFELYRSMPQFAGNLFADDERRATIQERVRSSAEYLIDHLHEVPVHVIPCIEDRVDGMPGVVAPSVMGSILPAAWSFCLAARARGLGTTWTTLHLMFEQQAAEVLGIPFDNVSQVALIPVAYTVGTDFRPAPREPIDSILHVDSW